MENINLNSILKRDAIEAEMMTILKDMEENDTLLMKRCIFIHGDPGIGKTTFVINALKERYDTIYFDGSDARTKTSIENLADNNIGQYNVTKLLNGIKKQIVIIMDDIESMNCGDKGGINALAKLVRPKKTKRQKIELRTINPIICICTNNIDKKIKEIMKVCHVIKLKTPTPNEMKTIYDEINDKNKETDISFFEPFAGDLRSLKLNIHNTNISQKPNHTTTHDVKQIVYTLLQKKQNFIDHDFIINDTHRTIVGLIYHENLANIINNIKSSFEFVFSCTLQKSY